MENSVTFLGVRGSIPVSGEAYRRYGCATTCYLIELEGETILVDAGNGILNLPGELMERPEITMLLSHPHLDHLMGLPMCQYLFRKGATLHMYAAVRGGMDAEAQVDALVAPPLWPVGAESLPGVLICSTLPETLRLHEVLVESMEGEHPGGVSIFRITGGGKRIVKISSIIVPVMGIAYVIISLVVIVFHAKLIPGMFAEIFRDAFNFRAIFGGVSSSCMIYGIKRGLYSNEAGVGSAPDVTHPVKQGLVQTVSVYIDPLLLCTATALMCLASGVPRGESVSGAPYVQNAISTVFGSIGPLFITVAMILFAFTTLIGNLYYCNNALAFLNHKKEPSARFMKIFHALCVLVIFAGAITPMDACWALADITMGGMTLINLPACVAMSGIMIKCLRDYETKKKQGINPRFKAADIGLAGTDFWN